MKSSIRAMLLVAAIAAVTGGCSSAEPDEGKPVDRSAPWFSTVNKDIEDAKAGGASQDQLKILDDAWKTGALTFEDYHTAVDRALRCVREAGFRVFEDKVTVYQGLKMRLYTVQTRADGANEPAVDGCLKQHSHFVEKAYQLQPASLEAKERHFKQYREALLACLAKAGIAVDPKMTETEISNAVGKAMGKGVNCFEQTGYNG